jgi:hypothetical protein
MKSLFFSLAAWAVLFLPVTARGQVPMLISYQGRVVVGGTNFDGSGQFKFALVNAAGTTAYWTNDGTHLDGTEPTAAVGLTVTKGLYSVQLGDTSLPNMTAVPPSVFNNSDVRLRVWFNDGTHGSQQLAPDRRIGAVGYAVMSANVPDGAITSPKIANGAVGQSQLAAGAVGQTQLAAGAVGAGQLANNSVGTAQLADGSITTIKIATGAVGNSQLAPDAVSGEFWSATNPTGAPGVRFSHTAIWTGSEMIVWGGQGAAALNDGGRYNPALNTWLAVSLSGAPAARTQHTAVWTGTEMIVWGGNGDSGPVNDGGRFNPITNAWVSTNLAGAPPARRSHTAVWTGSEMIIWGGGIGGGLPGVTKFNDGSRYNPITNAWAATNPTGTPSARYLHTAVWSGSEMIVWGGLGASFLNDGARYSPVSNSWTPTNLAGAPAARANHTSVWTGTQMIVFGGNDASGLANGSRYVPASDSWTSMASAAAARSGHTAVWTGNQMIVWGGDSSSGFVIPGERYNLGTNAWALLTNTGAPSGRDRQTAIWSGSEMIVWGGAGSNVIYGDGARLRLSNILPGSIGTAQLADPLQFAGATPSGSTLSGANSAAGGTGVSGASTSGNGIGVLGDGGTGSGIGVKGVSDGFSSIGVYGTSANGLGVAGDSTSGTGVFASTTTGFAVFGVSNGSGLAGRFDGDVTIFGRVQGFRGGGTGTLGGATAPVEGAGAGGQTGVLGTGGSPGGTGVSGVAGTNGYGVYGQSNQYAGWFAGAVNVTGSLFKGGGAFRIDHPLAPADKYLYHSFVESPDMMNLYNGVIVLDANGEAIVALPDWFSALNKDFRYQLTCLGGFAPVYIATEIADNRFRIAGGKLGLKVSWQVTGVRQDAWANAHRIPLEENKEGAERGAYLHPELYGQLEAKRIGLMRAEENPAAAVPALLSAPEK